MNLDELQLKAKELAGKYDQVLVFLDLKSKLDQLEEFEQMIAGTQGFWEDSQNSTKVLKQKKALELTINQAKTLSDRLEDLRAALDLAKEDDSGETLAEAESLCLDLEKRLKDAETQHLLSDEHDHLPCLVTLNAGAGGTESCDWAEMLLRMYLRYADRQGWSASIHDVQDGDGAGIKSATFEVDGHLAYGLLKSETGVHRLVRISPFDSNARRHTSFASVYVTPQIDDDFEVVVNDGDLRIDTYRASGAGGQHVNRTDSAVRITHAPSGIVVQCQSQRSQHQNRDQAMKMLRSKLYELEMNRRRSEQQKLEEGKADNSWGSQIRSYVLHPYKLVKDHRTGQESQTPDEVLDGDLSEFVRSYLVFEMS